jgi:hypothetical protein
LLKTFQYQREWHWLAARFSKENCSPETPLPNFKAIQNCPLDGFQKLLVQLQEICYPIGAKYMITAVLKSFLRIPTLLALNS